MDEQIANPVTIVDIKMPFLSMVVFMVKWIVASIPAIIILMVLGAIVAGVIGLGSGGF